MPEEPTVLVADDEAIVVNVVTVVLRKAGFRVLAATGGKQALELVRASEEPVSLAILDMDMPEINGPQLFIRLREIYPQMRALFMSGHNLPPASVPAGCDFVNKPFTASEFLRRVRQAADRPFIQSA
jgi:CheY-like chemotaxis protein